MRPRWVDDDPHPKPPRVGTTVIAKWRPWVYYLVSTIHVDGSSHLQRLMSSIETGIPFDRAPNRPATYVTQVVRCSRFGLAKSWDQPLLEAEYANLEEALIGHQRVVAQFTQSRCHTGLTKRWR